MSHHRSFEILNKLFNVTLPDIFNSSEAMNKLEKAKKMKKMAPVIFLVIAVSGHLLVSALIGGKDYGSALGTAMSVSIDLGGLLTSIWLTNRLKSSEMKYFEEEYHSVIREFSILILKNEDFRFNSIEKDINNNNNPALGN
jgi:hypothetical protein